MHQGGPGWNPRKCWTCGSTEHLSSFHDQPKKSDDSGKKKTIHTEHTAHVDTVNDDDEDGAFGVSDLLSEDESLPGPLSAESSDDERDNDFEESCDDW